jgi:hypothetical protein
MQHPTKLRLIWAHTNENQSINKSTVPSEEAIANLFADSVKDGLLVNLWIKHRVKLELVLRFRIPI